MSDWVAVGVVSEGQAIRVEGVNPWSFEWQQLDETPIELPHPSYPNQRHSMWIYEIVAHGKLVRFAAGELSANVWGFYRPVA